jgi:three-Cys-motif partner protein
MTELSSRLEGAKLPPGRLPAYAPHHKAKHGLLRHYMNAWFPKLGYSYPQTVVVDAFASAGRYRDGARGSPLIMLDAYAGRTNLAAFQAPPHFILIEPRLDFAKHLQAEVNELQLHGATVDVIHGDYEDVFPSVVRYLVQTYKQPLPTFLFVDPRGYRDSPFAHIRLYKQQLPRRTEAMVYLPVAFMARFAHTGLTDGALARCFDGDTWKAAITGAERREVSRRLGDHFRGLMHEQFERVTAFTVDPLHHNDYYLLFGTDHRDGLRAMKTAMWKVDRVAGSGYQQSAAEARGEFALFGDEEVVRLPYEETLPALLHARFGANPFSIEQAEDFTLEGTRYLDRPHLRRDALIPLQDSGKLTAVETTRRRSRDFPRGTVLRFVA